MNMKKNNVPHTKKSVLAIQKKIVYYPFKSKVCYPVKIPVLHTQKKWRKERAYS